MAQKNSAQLDFADQMIVRSTNLNQRLDQIARLINWNTFEHPLRTVFPLD